MHHLANSFLYPRYAILIFRVYFESFSSNLSVVSSYARTILDGIRERYPTGGEFDMVISRRAERSGRATKGICGAKQKVRGSNADRVTQTGKVRRYGRHHRTTRSRKERRGQERLNAFYD